MSKVIGHSCVSRFSFLISSASVQQDFGGLEVTDKYQLLCLLLLY